MNKLHITQDDHGYWMLSLEQENGTMTLLAHQFSSPDHLVENANEMVSEGHVDAVIIVNPPRTREHWPSPGATLAPTGCRRRERRVNNGRHLLVQRRRRRGRRQRRAQQRHCHADDPRPVDRVAVSGSCIVYGGDVYKEGKPAEFDEFLKQMDGDVTKMCEPPGQS